MERLKKFDEFLNEGGGLLPFLGAVLTGNVDLGLADKDSEEGEVASADGTYEPSTNYVAIPGNDDFTLYMQHQQGVAGAKGIVQAMLGTGEMAKDTIATKNGVKYANLVMNIPSNKPQVKKDVIAALDKGDQKTAAALFLNTWKEKWNSIQATAKTAINDPKNATVKDAIQKATTKHALPFDFAVTVAKIESGLNPKAGNSSYKGLFAMSPSSNYGGVVTPMGNKWSDPYVNAENGVKLLKDNIKQFKKNLGNDWASLKVGSWANNLV
jgi:hypothetical protein